MLKFRYYLQYNLLLLHKNLFEFIYLKVPAFILWNHSCSQLLPASTNSGQPYCKKYFLNNSIHFSKCNFWTGLLVIRVIFLSKNMPKKMLEIWTFIIAVTKNKSASSVKNQYLYFELSYENGNIHIFRFNQKDT